MSTTLNKKMSWSGILSGFSDKFKDILADALSAEEKLAAIQAELEQDVAEKRRLAREVGAQMRALADPETKELEPLEALKARRAKLVALGGKHISDAAKLAAIQTEVKSIDQAIAANQATYDTLEEAYGIAKGNYQASLDAYERVKSHAPAVLKAIAAHADAQKMRDKARDSKSVDISFMDDLTAELGQVKAAERADKSLDADLDATNSFSINAELEAVQADAVDTSLMAEFTRAAQKQSKKDARKKAA
jgi:hypothetical protein